MSKLKSKCPIKPAGYVLFDEILASLFQKQFVLTNFGIKMRAYRGVYLNGVTACHRNDAQPKARRYHAITSDIDNLIITVSISVYNKANDFFAALFLNEVTLKIAYSDPCTRATPA